MAITLNLFCNGAVGFIDWLDLFGFDLALCMILEYPSGTAKQEPDNYDADKRACRRMCDEPRIELENDDKDEHGHDCESTAAKNEKRESAGNGSYDNAEGNGDQSNQWSMLKVLLGKELLA